MTGAVSAHLATATSIAVTGTWQRHVPAAYAGTPFVGRSAQGRWGTDRSHPVLYLGKPTDSVVVEAYRHLIDPVVTAGGPAPQIKPRVLATCDLSVTGILDLRSPTTQALAGLTLAEMQSQTPGGAAYSACQGVSAAAYQLGFHGLVAPAATMLGETLVLFTDALPAAERPRLTSTTMWSKLPRDPRKVV